MGRFWSREVLISVEKAERVESMTGSCSSITISMLPTADCRTTGMRVDSSRRTVALVRVGAKPSLVKVTSCTPGGTVGKRKWPSASVSVRSSPAMLTPVMVTTTPGMARPPSSKTSPRTAPVSA